MAHPIVENRTPLAFEALYLSDENARPALVSLVQASYCIESDGTLTPAEQPASIKIGGEVWFPDAEVSSYKYEPQFALSKFGTDVALIGHACADGLAAELSVTFEVGPLQKTVRVIGDRYWVKSITGISMTSPEPFQRIPLIYERSFGGWDRTHPDREKHGFEPRNPVGTGFRAKHGKFEEGIRLPNLEDPRDPVHTYGQTVIPAGFGFTSPNWQPRASYAGTYDKTWISERMPLLPADFDRRFFNAASPALIAEGCLRGDEPVLIRNASPMGVLRFELPGVPPPICKIETVGRNHHELKTSLDTLTINTDDNLVLLLWRAYLPLRNGPHDVVSIEVVNGT